MHHYSNTVLWVYIVLLVVGGLIGFLKAGSKMSLLSSAIFAALLILAFVVVVFAFRLAKTKKFMPSGLLLLLTLAALACRNLPG